MRITIKGARSNFPTHVLIEENQWNHPKQEIKGSGPLTEKYNQCLLDLKIKSWEAFNNYTTDNQLPTPSMIKDYIHGTKKTNYSFVESIDAHIMQLKSRVGYDIAPSTIKNYESCKRKVVDFISAELRKEDILLSSINHQFIVNLDVFLRVKTGLHNNGVVKIMQQLKRVIKVALHNEWINKDPFTNYQCKIIEPKRVHLTKEELQKIESILLLSERLKKVRDVFVFSCYTGLSYADVINLNAFHFQFINNQDWIIIDRTKTKNQAVIPLLPKAKGILDKYNDPNKVTLLPKISSQNMNKYLKEIARTAGIHKHLSFHAARHTFASTVTLNAGVDIVSVSAMLGHKMLKTTQIYARVNLEKIAADVKRLMV